MPRFLDGRSWATIVKGLSLPEGMSMLGWTGERPPQNSSSIFRTDENPQDHPRKARGQSEIYSKTAVQVTSFRDCRPFPWLTSRTHRLFRWWENRYGMETVYLYI